jgi:Sad1 / UNC-like C-terminal
MSIGQIANTIDQHLNEADQRFKDHAAEVETNFTGQPEAQATRTTRRRASAPPRREESHDSANSDVRKTQRTAAWASSLESEQLHNITEEESELIDDDNTRHGTDPSSFPSGIFDNSYNYERGLRRPRIFDNSANAAGSIFSDLGGVVSQIGSDVARISRRAAHRMSEAAHSAGKATLQALPYVGLTILGLIAAVLAMMSLSFLFCSLYRRTLCDPSSTSSLQTLLQSYCGGCITSPYTLPENMTPEQQTDISFISKSIADLRRHLLDVEKRIDSKLDAKYSLFTTSIDELKERQRELESLIHKLESHSSSPSLSSSGHKINYFAPAAGAIINPLKSSPTLQRPPNFLWRSYQLLTGRVNYISNPPVTALEHWDDLGDCWCSAGSADVRLAVKMGYQIYPQEIVIEHYPSDGSPEPGTAPRDIETWASFAHLSPEEYAEKGIWNLVGAEPIFPGMGKIGTVRYDAQAGVQNLQTFRLDVNQGGLMHATDEVVVRVRGNYGASKTCLYRVRVHGVPVVPHPMTVELDG